MLSSPLTVQLFGVFRAHREGVSLPNLHLREGERLLACLILRNGESIPARELAKRFWPGEAWLNANGGGDFPAVRQGLYALRQALGPDAYRLTRPNRAIVHFDVEGIEADVLAFDRQARLEPAEPGSENAAQGTESVYKAWVAAAALYRSPLLADWDESWVVEARARRQRTYERLLSRLAQCAEQEEQKLPPATASSASISGAADSLRGDGAGPLSASLDEESAETPEFAALPVEPAGGAVPIASPYYIERDADAELRAALARCDSIVLIKGARQVGKTSLLARGLQEARRSGRRVVFSDLQKMNEAQFASPEAFYIDLAASISMQLELDVNPAEMWHAGFSPNANFEIFLQRHVLRAFPEPLVWGLDEVDRLFSCPFGTDVFGLFRSWHNERALNPACSWSRLTLTIAYATEAYLFIKDPNQSPFNVGTRLALEDFTLSEVAELNRRYGGILNEAEVERFHTLVGGQPYLVRRGLDAARRGLRLDRIETESAADDGPFGDHLRRLFQSLSRSPELVTMVREMLAGRPCASSEGFYRLRAGGVVAGSSAQDARLRCPLYRSYLARQFA